jgi:hypothetical protein
MERFVMEFSGISMTPHNAFEARINDCCDCRRCCRVERENGKGLF